MSFTNEQELALNDDSQNILIIACSGAGKTTVMVEKVLRYVEQGVAPNRIMFCSFTKKSANEIKSRLRTKLPEMSMSVYDTMWMGTIHSACVKILRRFHSHLGFPSTFIIADDLLKNRLVKEVGLKMNTDVDKIKYSLLAKVSEIKNNGNHSELEKITMIDCKRIDFKTFFLLYNDALIRNNAMDFDDILLNTKRLLCIKSVRPQIQDLFDVVMVDEFQDVNHVQYEIFRLIVQGTKIKYVVVGDDDQSIYGFRGSKIEYILNHEKVFPDVSIHKLTINHRCAKNIVALAEQVILPAGGRREKSLKTSKGDSHPVVFCEVSGCDEAEAHYVFKTIKSLANEEQLDLNRVAVLYRIQSQSKVFEDVFREGRLPYRNVGAYSFYKRKEVVDIMALIRLLTNNRDDNSVVRWINLPARGVGKTAVDKLCEENFKQGYAGLWKVIQNANNIKGLTTTNKKGINEFINFINKHSISSVETSEDSDKLILKAREFLSRVGYFEKLFSNSEERIQKSSNIEEVFRALSATINDGGTLQDFFDYMDDMENNEEETYGVNLMTIHASKGLEFDVVFIVGVCNGLIPHRKAMDAGDIDSERRLFYVALTRAERRLYLIDDSEGKTSLFLTDIKNFQDYVSHDEYFLDLNDDGIMVEEGHFDGLN